MVVVCNTCSLVEQGSSIPGEEWLRQLPEIELEEPSNIMRIKSHVLEIGLLCGVVDLLEGVDPGGAPGDTVDPLLVQAPLVQEQNRGFHNGGQFHLVTVARHVNRAGQGSPEDVVVFLGWLRFGGGLGVNCRGRERGLGAAGAAGVGGMVGEMVTFSLEEVHDERREKKEEERK